MNRQETGLKPVYVSQAHRIVGWLGACAVAATCSIAGLSDALAEDLMTVPFLKQAPVMDGKINDKEWQAAAATTGFVNYQTGRMVDLQPVLYLGYDEENLYVGFKSWGGALRAECINADSPEICSDDAVELMVAPGQGADFKRPEFATYQIIFNSIGVKFDTYYLHNRAEDHPEWSVGGQIAQKTEDGLWTVEMKIPFATFGVKTPSSGAVWSFNIARISNGAWIALKSAPGPLNYPESGISIRFDASAPAVRLLSLDRIIQGKAGLSAEVVNSTDKPLEASADFLLSAAGQYADKKPMRIEAGQVANVRMGNDVIHGRDIAVLTWNVQGPQGRTYFRKTLTINYPLAAAPRLSQGGGPVSQLFYFYPRYYPSLDRLVIESNFSRFSTRDAVRQVAVSVYSDGPMTTKVLTVTEAAGKDFADVIRRDMSNLADGKYYVKGELLDAKSSVLATVVDWFEKARPDWLVHKAGISEKVIPPFTPLRAQRQEVDCWGRQYHFGDDGLVEQLVTADVQILAEPVTLAAASNGKAATLQTRKPFQFGQIADHRVTFASALEGAGLEVSLEGSVEYDGLLLMKLTYGPKSGQSPTLDSFRLQIPIKQENASLYIAHPDNPRGMRCGEFPRRNGIVFNSKEDLKNQKILGTFVPYLWVGDMDRGFCWAAESDEGWVTDDAKPCLEVERRDKDVVLRFNIVNKPARINRNRTIAFGLQASPVKPVDNKWRGVWPEELFKKGEVPVIFRLLGGAPPGSTSLDWTRPDSDPKQQERGYKRLRGDGFKLNPDLDVVSGYYPWYGLAKSEVGVFRGEWVQSKSKWDAPMFDYSNEPLHGPGASNCWGPYAWGKDPDNYRSVSIVHPPSFVDLQVWSFEEAVKIWKINGFYDDCGYMLPVYDKDLSLGYVRGDGKEQPCVPIFSVYRAKWKRCAYVLDSLGRENFLCPWSNYNALPVAAWGGALAVGEQETLFAQADDFVDLFVTLPRFSSMFVARQFGLACLSCQSTGKVNEKGQGRQAMLLYCLHDINPCWVPSATLNEYKGPARGKVRFRPWEPDVTFHGYWNADQALKVEGDGIKVSYYTAKDRVMFVVGNVSKSEVTAVLRPDWTKLGVAPRTLFDAESDAIVEVSDGAIRMTMPPRGLRLIIATQNIKERP